VGVVSGVAGLIGGVSNFFEGRSQRKKAESFINNFKWQDLQNPYKNLQVSTLGADFQREQANIAQATAINAMQMGGNRGLANIGRIVAGANDLNRSIAANLDQQQKQIDYATAQDETQIRSMVERRQAEELAGYGRMLGQGQQMQQQGMADIVNATGALGQSVQGINFGGSGQASLPRRLQSLPDVAPTGVQQYPSGTAGTFYNQGQPPYLSGGLTYGMGTNSYLNQ
jgi:hypothetical protein